MGLTYNQGIKADNFISSVRQTMESAGKGVR